VAEIMHNNEHEEGRMKEFFMKHVLPHSPETEPSLSSSVLMCCENSKYFVNSNVFIKQTSLQYQEHQL
jgi:hypothetical protein